MKLYHTVENGIHKVSNTIVWVSGFALMLIAVLTFIDVFCRYLFNSPITGAQEVCQMSIMIVVYMGLPCATLRRRHIRVDALINKFSERARLICLGCTSLIVNLYSIPAFYFLTKQSISLFHDLNKGTTLLGIPYAPFYLIVAFGCLWMSLELILDGIRYFGEAKAVGTNPAGTVEGGGQ